MAERSEKLKQHAARLADADSQGPAGTGLVRIFVRIGEGLWDAVSGVVISPWWVLTTRRVVSDAALGASLADVHIFAPDPLSTSFSPILELPRIDRIDQGYTGMVALHLSQRWEPPGMVFPQVSWVSWPDDPLATDVIAYGYGPAGNAALLQQAGPRTGTITNPYAPDTARSGFTDITLGVVDSGSAGGPVFSSSPQSVGAIQDGLVYPDQKTLSYCLLAYETDLGFRVRSLPTDVAWAPGGTVSWSTYAIDYPDTGGWPLWKPAGYRVFYKKASDGASWANAGFVDVDGADAKIAALDDSLLDTTHVWKFTVLARLSNGTLLSAGPDNKPLDGDLAGSTAWGTTAYSFPSELGMISAGDHGVILSWVPTEYSPGNPDITGYKIFLWDTQAGAWATAYAWAEPGASSIVLSPLDAREWMFAVLPVVGDTVLGVGEDGYPLAGSQSSMTARYAPPRPAGQYPNAAGQAFFQAGGCGSILARFTNSDAGALYQWEWAAATAGGAPGGDYTSDRDWSHTNGGNDPTLWFGGLEADGQAQAADTGWYRLKATNGLGSAYSDPVHVVIYDRQAPVLIEQAPSAGTKIYSDGSAWTLFNGMTLAAGSYQWQQSTNQYGPWSEVPGAREPRLRMRRDQNWGPWFRAQANNQFGTAYSEPVCVDLSPESGTQPAITSQQPHSYLPVTIPAGNNPKKEAEPRIVFQRPSPAAQVLIAAYRSDIDSTSDPGEVSAIVFPNTLLDSWTWVRGDARAGTFYPGGEWLDYVINKNDTSLTFVGNGNKGVTGWYSYSLPPDPNNNDIPPSYSSPVLVTVVDGNGSPAVVNQSTSSVRGRAGRVGTATMTVSFSNMYGISGGYFVSPNPGICLTSMGGTAVLSFGTPDYPAAIAQSGTYWIVAQNPWGVKSTDFITVTIDSEGVSNWGASDITATGLTGVGSTGTLTFSASNGVDTPSSVRATGTFIRVITLPPGLEIDTARPFTWDPWDGGGNEPLATVDATGTVVTWYDMSYGGLVEYTEEGVTITLKLVVPDSEQDNWPGRYDYSQAKPINIPVTITSDDAWTQPVIIEWRVSAGTVLTSSDHIAWYDLQGEPELIGQAPDAGQLAVLQPGSVGALAITAHFSTDRSGDTFQWERASSPGGSWTSNDESWSNKAGANSRVLVFGVNGAAATAYDFGWYRLTTISWTGDEGHSEPVQVSTSPAQGWQYNPKFLSQVPAGGTKIEVDVDSVGEVSISAFPLAAGAGTLQWQWAPNDSPSLFQDRDWSRMTGRNSTTLTFGVREDGVMVEDQGWYRLAWDPGQGNPVYSDPVQVALAAGSVTSALRVLSPRPRYYQRTEPIPVYGTGVPSVGFGAEGYDVTLTINGQVWTSAGVALDKLWEVAQQFDRPGQWEIVATQSLADAPDQPPARVLFSFGTADAPASVAPPVFTSPQKNDGYSAPVSVSGTGGMPGALILLQVNDEDWKTIVVTDNKWDAGTLDRAGEITLSARQVFANVFSIAATLSYTLLPEPVFTDPQQGGTYYYDPDDAGSGVVMNGNGVPGATVTVTCNKEPQGNPALVNGDGVWHAGVFSQPDGHYTLDATQTLDDFTGPPASVSFELRALPAPTVSQPCYETAYANYVVVEGLGTPGAQIMLTLNGQPWGQDENPDGIWVDDLSIWDAGVFWPEDVADYPPSGNEEYSWVIQATQVIASSDGTKVRSSPTAQIPFNCTVVAPNILDTPVVVFPRPGGRYLGGNGPGWWQQGQGIPVAGSGFTGATVTVTVDKTLWKENIPVKDGMWDAGFWNQPGHHDMVVTQSFETKTSAPTTLSFDYDNAPDGLPGSPYIIRPTTAEHFGTTTGLIYGRGVIGESQVALTLNGDYWTSASVGTLMPLEGGSTLWEWIANSEWTTPGVWVLGVTQTLEGKTSTPTYVAFSIEN